MNNDKNGQMSVFRLSEVSAPELNEGAILIMVGSFAPPHVGHIAAMTAAYSALEALGQKIAGMVYVPNTDSYVSVKVEDTRGIWRFSRRVNLLLEVLAESPVPTFVDDISGSSGPIRSSITEEAMGVAADKLYINSNRLIIVVGSD